jgi:hypothetical protein
MPLERPAGAHPGNFFFVPYPRPSTITATPLPAPLTAPRPTPSLHPSHQAVLDAIRAYIARYRIAPAVRDIAYQVHKAPNAVVASILALERAGYLSCLSRRGRRIARGILLHPAAPDAVNTPTPQPGSPA